MRLKDKVAIVTGSTSGMGIAIATLFAQEGAKVMVVGRSEERAKKVVDSIRKDGGIAEYVLADFSDLSTLDPVVEETVAKFGTVDILCNNAGSGAFEPMMEISLENWNKEMNINCNSVMYLSKKAAPIMKAKGSGIIINTTSIAGYNTNGCFGAYVTSKHGEEGLTKAMANELGPEIRVNAIAPGLIETEGVKGLNNPDAMQMMINMSPLKRIGKPIDIARVALFLATEESSFINGQSIRVDGGFGI